MAFSIPEAPSIALLYCIGLNANAHKSIEKKTLIFQVYLFFNFTCTHLFGGSSLNISKSLTIDLFTVPAHICVF